MKSGNGYSQRVPATPERRNGCQPSPKDHAGRLGGSPRQLNVFACKPASIGAFTPPPLSSSSSSSSSPEPPGRPGHPPVPPSPTQMDLAGPSCPLWSLWPASARSSAHRSTRAGHHEHVVRLQRAGWGGGAGSSSRGHRPRARATTSRPLRWTGPSRLQPAQTPRRGPFSSRFVPSSACPASVGTLRCGWASWRADSSSPPHPPIGGAVGEGPDGRVHGPNGAVASHWAPRGGRGHLGPPWAGLGGRAGPLKVGTSVPDRDSCSQIRRPSAGPRCASVEGLTRGGVPRAQTASNAVRLDPNGAQVPELCGALGVGLRRRCRKTPPAGRPRLELVSWAAGTQPWG